MHFISVYATYVNFSTLDNDGAKSKRYVTFLTLIIIIIIIIIIIVVVVVIIS